MAKPPIKYRHKICVICEGFEDIGYFEKLIQLNVWCNDIYDFILINAKSASNIFPRYQDAYSSDSYEVILIFCDTDKAPYREYSQIKKKINNYHAKDRASDKIIIFANPCTMQIILSHFADINLKNQGKGTNRQLIEQLTGIINYDAHVNQVKELCSKIFRRSYPEMKIRIEKMNLTDTISGSTNFITFLKMFESENYNWISSINSFLQEGNL